MNERLKELAEKSVHAVNTSQGRVNKTEKNEHEFECPRCGHCCREWVGLTKREPLLREIAALSANALDDYKMIQKLMAERQPLTDEEIDVLVMDSDGLPTSHLEFARAIEAAHGITGEKKNNG